MEPPFPNNVDLHIQRGSAAGQIINTQFENKYLRPQDISDNYIVYYRHMADLNRRSFALPEQLAVESQQVVHRLT